MTAASDPRLAMIRLRLLFDRHREVLSDFEAELVAEVLERRRTQGDALVLTFSERWVLADALAALETAASARAAA